MKAYHLDSASFFKPALELDKVKSVMVSSFPDNVQQHLLARHAPQNTVLTATSVSIDGIKYAADMVVSVGSCAGLPEFRQIQQILVVDTNVLFICRQLFAWYHKHLRAVILTIFLTRATLALQNQKESHFYDNMLSHLCKCAFLHINWCYVPDLRG